MATEYKIIGGDGREYGPASLEELRQWCEDGRVAHGTPVWRNDQQRWQPAAGWDELKWDLPKFSPPPTPPSSSKAGKVSLRAVPAGFFIRLGAYLIDWLIVTSFITLITLPWAEWLTTLQRAAVAEATSTTPDYDILRRFVLVALAINLPIGFIYQTFFNGRLGATPGKQLLGLRIVREDGSHLGYRRAALRFAAELVTVM